MTKIHDEVGPAVASWQARRRRWVLERLAEADGVTYDDLCKETVTEFPVVGGDRYLTSRMAVRAIRNLLFEGLATTESDETVWLSPAGWQALEEARKPQRYRRAS